MDNPQKLAHKVFVEIEELVHLAIEAYNKKQAAPSISRLKFIAETASMAPYARNVLFELIGSVTAAAGQVRDKEHWLYHVNQSLCKLAGLSERE